MNIFLSFSYLEFVDQVFSQVFSQVLLPAVPFFFFIIIRP